MVSQGYSDDLSNVLFAGRREAAQRYTDVFSESAFDQDWWAATKDPGKRAYERYLQLLPRLDAVDTISDLRALVALHEQATVVDPHLGALLTVQVNLVLGTLLEQHSRTGEVEAVLTELLEGRAVGAYVLTEVGHGSDLPNLETTATYDPADGGSFVLDTPTDAAVKFMPTTAPPPVNGVSRFGIVFARLLIDGANCGNYPFLVRLVDTDGTVRPGITIRALPEKPGLGMDNSITRFDHVRLPRECLLSHTGTFIDDNGQLISPIPADNQVWRAISRVRAGRLAISAMSAAVCRASLAIALKHAEQRDIASMDRGADRIALLDVPAHRDRLIDAIAETYMAGMSVEVAIEAFSAAIEKGADEQAPELTDLVSLTKNFTTSVALRVTAEVRDRLGAQGVFAHNQIMVYRALRDAAATAEGDSYVIGLQAAYRRIALPGEWKQSGWNDQLFDIDTHGQWLSWLDDRARFLHHRTLEAYANTSGSRQERWDAIYHLSMAAAEAHTAHQSAQALADRIGGIPTELREVLERLIVLYAVGQCLRHGTEMLPDGPLPKTAQPLMEMRRQLHEFLAPHLRDLVDAFELPSGLLRTAFTPGTYVEEYASAISAASTD
ncbi:hypothetical protein HGA13_00780 [Nocardia speluncae]|uniref:Acyl-CoA oxidase n=1 Tax=Nocardia speluncae TaxID=419477 RepID=A0A846X672_9NOCA|nr:acyl-CoA dehydrogenase [Nocardia speluncae]NKY31611.1 hypothetical protein [Nocardia speluncae]